MAIFKFPRAPREMPCYVRERNTRADGFVEFDFAIGDPELSVDLILPIHAFKEFCETNRVTFLTAEQGERIDAEHAKWRLGHAGLQE